MIKVRNTFYAPNLEGEGRFKKPLPGPKTLPKDAIWYTGLKPYERLFYHQTLSNVRKCWRFEQNPNIPKDSLDFQLSSRYFNGAEPFPEKVDFVLQNETIDGPSFRILRNTKDVFHKLGDPLGHPLKIGGLKVKISPDSIKLINSGHHTPLTNNGYSRQTGDGNFFHY